VVLVLAAIIVQVSLNANQSKISRVACMGDSITDNTFTRYTIDLQTMLGDKYDVGTFGIAGATALYDTYWPYAYQTEFLEGKNFQPDIVVIMLGTNDARTDNFESIDNFVEDYTKIIKQIQSLGTKPKIFVVKPPPIFENSLDLQPESFSEEIIPRIEQVANEQQLEIIDVYSVMQNHPEYLLDGVHPNNKGSNVIATQVYNAIIGSD
jgi:lysophospholipase L1-like esterase